MSINVKRLEFTRGPVRDRLDTGRVVLDVDATPYRIVMLWRPVLASWRLSLWLTSGTAIATDLAVRDRTDCLLGVSTPGRPRGAIISYDPKRRGDPTLNSYALDDVRLYYLPDGFDPADFAAYPIEVV